VLNAITDSAEPNSFDVINNPGVTWGGTCSSISDVPVGTGDTNRVGDMITPISIEIGARLSMNTSNVVQTLRVVLLRWENDDTSHTPAVGEIFQPTLATVYPAIGAFERDGSRGNKFTVIRQWMFTFDTYNLVRHIHEIIKLDKTVKLCYTGASVGGMHKYYICMVSDTANAAGVNIYTRLNYFEDF